MSFAWRSAILGVFLGVAASAIAVHAHGDPHAGPHAGARPSDLLSAAGRPAELAARSRQLAAHLCEVIEAGDACTLPALAERAAADLQGLAARETEAQSALHHALLAPSLTESAWTGVEDEQIALLDVASRRYLRFLADAAATLDAEQKRRFAH